MEVFLIIRKSTICKIPCVFSVSSQIMILFAYILIPGLCETHSSVSFTIVFSCKLELSTQYFIILGHMLRSSLREFVTSGGRF
jgi:hypothetical protein